MAFSSKTDVNSSIDLSDGYDRLAQSLIDIIKEQQAKLGYRKEIVRLYYPLSSLNHFFEGHLDSAGMLDILKEASLPECITDKLGCIKATEKNDRFCIEIPPQGSEYVYENTSDDEFINELIKLVAEHGCRPQQIIDLFKRFSDEIEIKQMDNGEFDFYVRFLNDPQDTYYYCFHDEGCHMIYHRFLPQDYSDFEF